MASPVPPRPGLWFNPAMSSTDWFDTARFGMFIHWSHCSQSGWELSWPLVGGAPTLPYCQDVPVAEYHAGAATFAPQPGAAREWARLAKAAGVQYATMTAKHHDGYAMFDTKLSDWSVTHSPCGRDLVREFVDAFRAEGIRIGLYYSLIDWHHPDYPAFTDVDKPYRWFKWPRPTAEQWDRFLPFLFGQVRELLTNYGSIDLLWFDGGWERSAEQWKSLELRELIRALQPACLVNDRLPSVGDFTTPEQFIPPAPPEGRWETCMTINESWGYNPSDPELKSSRDMIHALCEVASRGGNLLLNVSPMGDGRIAPEHIERFKDVAVWMQKHSETVVGTQPGLEPWQFYGPSTRRGETVYLHCLMRPYEAVTARGVRVHRIKSVRHVATGRDLAYSVRMSIIDEMANRDPKGEVRISVPQELIDPFATVIAIEFEPD